MSCSPSTASSRVNRKAIFPWAPAIATFTTGSYSNRQVPSAAGIGGSQSPRTERNCAVSIGLGGPASLKLAPHRRNPLRIEAQPMHPAHISRVLDLQAAVHDDVQAAFLGKPRALLVDHAELAPENARVDRDGFPGDRRQRIGSAEDVDDVHPVRHIRQAGVAHLSEDLGLARIDRDNPVAVALEVEADEVAWAQRVRGQADDGDRVRAMEHALDRQRVLVSLEIQLGHLTPARPRSRSQIRSSTDSVPTESLIVPGRTPAAWSSASLSWRCVVLAGWMIRLLASPTLARCDQSVTARIRSWPAARPPAQSNENTAPAPRGRYFATSDSYALLGSPGYVTFETASWDSRNAATARAFSTWRSMRSDSVSRPCRNRNALNGDSAAPRSRSVSARSFIRKP